MPNLAPTPKLNDAPESGLVTCSAARDPLNPFIVEWAATRKTALEVATQQGPVVVSYSGCVMKILPRCHATGGGTYEMQKTTPEAQSIAIEDESQLRASLPLSVAAFEGELHSGRRLTLDYVAVGQKVLSQPPTLLAGECAGATHYVSSLVVGAFSISSEASLNGALKVSAGTANGEAGGSSKRQLRGSSGDLELCKNQGSDNANCSGLLELGLSPMETAVSGTVAAAGFGTGLGSLAVMPKMGALQELDTSTSGALSNDNLVTLLQKLQAAKRSERDAQASPESKAEAWDQVAKQEDPNAFAPAAAQRRDDWTRVANAQRLRREQVERAWLRYGEDKARLDKLLALDDDVVSAARKVAYRKEFDSVYNSWQNEFVELHPVEAHAAGMGKPIASPGPPPSPETTAVSDTAPTRQPVAEVSHATRNWGIGLGVAGLALLGGAYGATHEANDGKAKIESGGLGKGSDIEARASSVRLYQGLSYAGYSLGGVLVVIGTSMLIFGPSGEGTVAGIHLRNGVMVW